MPLMELRQAIGSPPPTTTRTRLRQLTELGILHRDRQSEFPGSVEYALGRAGDDLVEVTSVLRAWLEKAPGGPISLASTKARGVIKALADGWSSSVVRALAAAPISLTELDRLIADLNYPSLERRVSAMKMASLIRPWDGKSRGTPYTVTPWMREGVAPLLASAAWERSYLEDSSAYFGASDVEAVCLLASPLIEVSEALSGDCRLAVHLRQDGGRGIAGAVLKVRGGRVESCICRLQEVADAWVSGTARAWFQALATEDITDLESGGDCALAAAIVAGLGRRLSGHCALPPAE
jgi:DNA-binding HxlR family transcriptional regulator